MASDNLFLTTEAYRRTYSDQYASIIQQDFNINTGIIGLPPNFDFLNAINEKLQYNIQWQSHFDEQSIVALILQEKQTLIINKNKINVCFGSCLHNKGTHGVHFVGLNGNEERHWNSFFSFF